QWTTLPVPYTAEHARVFVEQTAPNGWAAGTAYGFAGTDLQTGELLANVVLIQRSAPDGWEVGYWGTEAGRGRGTTTDALIALCRWGFAALGIDRIEWYAGVGNWASRRVAEKAGFTIEGVLRKGLPGRSGRVDGWVGARLAGDPDTDTGQAWGHNWQDLEGDGLVLRRWRDDDVDPVVAGLSDPEAARWLDVPTPYRVEDARHFLDQVKHRWADGTAAPLAVEQGGAVVGLVVVIPSPADNGLAEIGWWTVPAARGHRIAARAVQVLVPWATSIGLVRLEAGIDVDNAASRRVAERAGMLLEGTRVAGLRGLRGGPRRDGLLYARVTTAGPWVR
ncbi:MAG: family N-acetyltransferase, partial [Frankiales bacterium]|nr:family N-acetyltransferase [Frankiales bacterium]